MKDVHEQTVAVRGTLTGVLKSKLPPEGGRVNVSLGDDKDLVVVKADLDSLQNLEAGETKLRISTNMSEDLGPVTVEVGLVPTAILTET